MKEVLPLSPLTSAKKVKVHPDLIACKEQAGSDVLLLIVINLILFTHFFLFCVTYISINLKKKIMVKDVAFSFIF